MSKDIFISIIIPVYNGERTIRTLYHEIEKVCTTQKYSYEVIFVWDCGPDQSWEQIQLIKSKYPEKIKAIHLSRNYGQHNALICGFQFAEGKYALTLDEDLQQHPEDIPLLVKKQEITGADVVYGIPEINNHNQFRNLSSDILRYLIRKSITGIHKDYSPFRLIKSEIATELDSMQNSYTFLDGYLTWLTNRFTSVQIKHHKRLAGKSSYNLNKLFNHSMNIFLLLNYPIKFLNSLSFLIIIASISYSIFLLIRRILFDDLIPGFASLSISIGFSTGVLMIGISVLARYIARINDKTTRKPNYVIRKII